MHYGLYFDEKAVTKVQASSDEQQQAALAFLTASPGTVLHEVISHQTDEDVALPIVRPELTPIGQALVDATAYRFLADAKAGGQAVAALQNGIGFAENDDLLAAIWEVVSISQVAEMVRDHPDFATFQAEWLAAYRQKVAELLQPEPGHLIHIWQITLRIVAAVVLEEEALFNEGVAQFRQIIDEEVHAEGYLKFIAKNKDGNSFMYQLLGVAALTLAAEAATYAGEPLWQYEQRGVSLTTAVAYIVYYYFFPEKWHWGEEGSQPASQHVREAFTQYGAFVAIAEHRKQPRFAKELLEEMAPLFSELGGLTSLTHFGHAEVEHKKKFLGLF
ncbi:MAG: alginate lyase family protein [Anaerolineae bacterium]|nr:alginate lyase family protein [Anaerolineae bacterium]